MFKVKAPCTKRAHQTAQMVVKLDARREREDPGEEWRCPRRKEDEDWKANWRALREGGGGVINNGCVSAQCYGFGFASTGLSAGWQHADWLRQTRPRQLLSAAWEARGFRPG